MENDKMIIIALVAVLAVIVVGIGYMLLNPQTEYETIHLSNGTTIEVPKADDATWNHDESGIKTYLCSSKRTTLMSFNSQEDLTLVGAGAFALAREALMTGATNVEMYKDYQIKENTINGTKYYIVYVTSNETHDNIVLASGNLDILKHMLNSLVLGPPGDGPANATVSESSGPQPTTNNNNSNSADKNKYTEDDLRRASQEGYSHGYSDGIDDSSNNYDDSKIETTTDSGSSSGKSGAVEDFKYG